MQSNNKKKICLVVSSLGKGGAERSSALLSRILDSLGCEVHIVLIQNNIDYQYKGILFNLGALKDKNNSKIAKLKRFLLFRNYIRKHQFDYIIDNRTRTPSFREFMLGKFVFDLSKTIMMVRSFKISSYFPKSRFVANYLVSRAYKVVGVSKEISEEIKKTYLLKDVPYIYNPIEEFEEVATPEFEFEYVLAFGRLDDEIKNYSLLIDAYQVSRLRERKVKLIILGNGKDEAFLKSKVTEQNLNDDVLFFDFVKNPSGYIKTAKYVCLTSRVEGFPRSLVEALSLDVPVISVDCKSGPKEIIINGENGLLVENYNPKALANAMNSFIFEENQYNSCKNNAPESIAHLRLESISAQWKQLLYQP
ncbi:MAG: glycosyltransferase [Flavobacteriaceae bacterium]|nr:glycosyltransferase [Flavobacteriaceae bacterium]